MRAWKALLIVVVVLFAALPAWGQEIVRSIEFRGLKALPEETLRFYLSRGPMGVRTGSLSIAP